MVLIFKQPHAFPSVTILLAVLVCICSGCGSLTRYYHTDSPSNEEQQAILGCLDRVLSQNGFHSVSCSGTKFQGRKVECIRRYAADHGITITAALDATTHTLLVLPHPVPAYAKEPDLLQAVRKDLQRCFEEKLVGGRVQFVETWKQHWIWDFITLAP